MEYDNIRSGSFEPLQFLPKEKVVVLGLVTTKVGTVRLSACHSLLSYIIISVYGFRTWDLVIQVISYA